MNIFNKLHTTEHWACMSQPHAYHFTMFRSFAYQMVMPFGFRYRTFYDVSSCCAAVRGDSDTHSLGGHLNRVCVCVCEPANGRCLSVEWFAQKRNKKSECDQRRPLSFFIRTRNIRQWHRTKSNQMCAVCLIYKINAALIEPEWERGRERRKKHRIGDTHNLLRNLCARTQDPGPWRVVQYWILSHTDTRLCNIVASSMRQWQLVTVLRPEKMKIYLQQ